MGDRTKLKVVYVFTYSDPSKIGVIEFATETAKDFGRKRKADNLMEFLMEILVEMLMENSAEKIGRQFGGKFASFPKHRQKLKQR